MLHSLFVSTLLAASTPAGGTVPTALSTDALMDLLAPGSGALVRLANTAERLSSDDAGAWVGALADPGVQTALKGLLQEFDAEDVELGKNVLACLAACRGGVVAFPELGDKGIFAAMEVSDEFLPRMTEMLGALGVPTAADVEFAGRKADLMVYVDDLVIPMVRSGSHLLIGHGTLEVASATFTHYAQRIEAADSTVDSTVDLSGKASEHPWWHALDGRVQDPLMEAFVDLPGLLGDEFPDVALADYVTTGYVGLSACAANACESGFYLNLGPNEALAELMGSFRAADRDFLRLAPEGVLRGGVFAMDFVEFTRGVQSFAASVDESVGAQLDAGIVAASAALGIDVMEELLPAFTGEILMLTFLDPEDMVGDLSDAEVEEELPTVVFGVADMEPLVTLAEFGENFLEGALTVSDRGDYTIWTVNEDMLGLSLCIAISEKHLLLGPPKRVSPVMAMIAGGEGAPAGALDEDEWKSLPDSQWLAFQDVDATWDALDDVLSVALAQGPEMGSIIDVGSAVLMSLKGRMKGLTVSTIEMSPARMAVRVQVH